MSSTLLRVAVFPGARVSSLERGPGGEIRVRLAARAIEGRANRELVRFLASRLSLPASAVRVVKGAGSRYKTLEIDGLATEDVESRLWPTMT